MTDRLISLAHIPEAPWVTAMREHKAQHGFYRQGDLNRLLGSPGDSATIDANGSVVLRRAAAELNARKPPA